MMNVDRIVALIVALAGLIAGGLHFTLIYAVATLACLRPETTRPAFDIRAASVVLAAIMLSGIVIFTIHRLRNGRTGEAALSGSGRFLNVIAVAFGLLAIVGVLWVTLPVFMIADCRTQ
jgi:hypothetical protein